MIKTTYSDRRSDFDVTNRIQVTLPGAVKEEVCRIYTETYGSSQELMRINRAFNDFESLFTGNYPGYFACDTLYHDLQHTLDVTLAMARLLNGYERTHQQRLGERRFALGIIIALFHDAGYIRTQKDSYAPNGAIYTLTHVTRSAAFLKRYLPLLGLETDTDRATQLVHFTGYELDITDIHLDSADDRTLGQLLGTADLIAQMADRCYLEKCRDRLYPEFVICGLAGEHATRHGALFASAKELLQRTPEFYRKSVKHRLHRQFNQAFQYVENHFLNNSNPYMELIHKNIRHLDKLSKQGEFKQLNRKPPLTLAENQFPYEMVG